MEELKRTEEENVMSEQNRQEATNPHTTSPSLPLACTKLDRHPLSRTASRVGVRFLAKILLDTSQLGTPGQNARQLLRHTTTTYLVKIHLIIAPRASSALETDSIGSRTHLQPSLVSRARTRVAVTQALGRPPQAINQAEIVPDSASRDGVFDLNRLRVVALGLCDLQVNAGALGRHLKWAIESPARGDVACCLERVSNVRLEPEIVVAEVVDCQGVWGCLGPREERELGDVDVVDGWVRCVRERPRDAPWA